MVSSMRCEQDAFMVKAIFTFKRYPNADNEQQSMSKKTRNMSLDEEEEDNNFQLVNLDEYHNDLYEKSCLYYEVDNTNNNNSSSINNSSSNNSSSSSNSSVTQRPTQSQAATPRTSTFFPSTPTPTPTNTPIATQAHAATPPTAASILPFQFHVATPPTAATIPPFQFHAATPPTAASIPMLTQPTAASATAPIVLDPDTNLFYHNPTAPVPMQAMAEPLLITDYHDVFNPRYCKPITVPAEYLEHLDDVLFFNLNHPKGNTMSLYKKMNSIYQIDNTTSRYALQGRRYLSGVLHLAKPSGKLINWGDIIEQEPMSARAEGPWDLAKYRENAMFHNAITQPRGYQVLLEQAPSMWVEETKQGFIALIDDISKVNTFVTNGTRSKDPVKGVYQVDEVGKIYLRLLIVNKPDHTNFVPCSLERLLSSNHVRHLLHKRKLPFIMFSSMLLYENTNRTNGLGYAAFQTVNFANQPEATTHYKLAGFYDPETEELTLYNWAGFLVINRGIRDTSPPSLRDDCDTVYSAT